MFQERNQSGGAGDDLRRGHVHVLDAVRAGENRFAVVTGGNEFLRQTAVLVHLGVGLSDDVAAFLNGGQVGDFLRRDAVDHLAVRRFKEAVFVEAGVRGERVDKTDVRTFRRFNWADATVVGRMHVSDFEAGAFASQTTRAKGRNTALVSDFRQRVRLVHELGQLARAEELANGGADRLGVDQILRREAIAFSLVESFLDSSLNAHEAGAELVFGEFADTADTTVAQVVDVVDAVDHAGAGHAVGIKELDGVLTVAQGNEDGHRVDDVFAGKRHGTRSAFTAETGIDLHAADAGQIVRFGIEEETVEQSLDSVFRGRFARTHHAVDRDACGELIRRVVQTKRGRDVGTVVEFVREDREDRLDLGDAELGKKIGRDFVVAVGNDFTCFLVNDVLAENAAENIFVGNGNARHAGLRQVADVLGGDALVGGHHFLAVGNDREADGLALQAFGNERKGGAVGVDRDFVEREEARKDVFRRQAEGLEQNRAGHLAAAVDAEVQDVLGVEFEVKPGAAVRNHASREEQLAGGVRLALVMFKENAGRTVQLADDDAFRAVDDERALLRHERDFAHVDVIFANFLQRLGLGGIAVKDFQLDLGAKTAAERQAAELALGDVEFRFSKLVIDEAKTCVTVVAGNREDGSKRCLQTVFGIALVRGNVRLQKFFVGTKLSIKQGRHFKDARARGKALADALLFSERVRHGHSVRH